MPVLVVFALTTLAVSFVCSLLESVILSVTHTHIALLIKEGKGSGHLLRNLKKNINHPLAAILTLNTVANTVGAAGVGAEAYKLFGNEWVAVASGIFTVMILIFSEMIPKTIGAVFWKKLAHPAAYMIRILIFFTYPVVVALEMISQFIARRGSSPQITREELLVLAELGVKEGILDKNEAHILENLLLLREIKAGDVMTPRSVLMAFETTQTVGDVVRSNAPLRFTRIPVYEKNLDRIVGFALKGELIEAFHTGRADEMVGRLAKPIRAIPDTKIITDLLDDMLKKKAHILVVVDEFGGTAGIVTLEDAVETLLGVEIVDEIDTVADMRAYALAVWKRRKLERQTL